jgi:hypothetical protein
MASCVPICWSPNEQWVKCMPNAFNPCPHAHVRRLNAKSWIKPKWKCNIEVNIKCAMQNEQIDGLTTNHTPNPLPKQKWMRALDVEEMESSSKINDLRDVSWWMSIINAYRFRALITVRFSKKRCISLIARKRSSCVTPKHD